MRIINFENWPRRKHFEFFNAFDYPHFNLCSQVEVTHLAAHIKRHKLSVTLSIAYLLTKAANNLVEFRYRIRDHQVVEHDIIHPSLTILAENELFSFCTIDYFDNFATYITESSKQVAHVKEHPSLEDPPGRDDLLYMTALPWITFTSFMHPIHLHPVDSVPRFAWGKIYEEGKVLKLPLSVQVHHGLMDGFHVGKYFTLLQQYIDNAEKHLVLDYKNSNL